MKRASRSPRQALESPGFSRGEDVNTMSENKAIRKPRHPAVRVNLDGSDRNAFATIGIVTDALSRAGASQAEVDEFIGQAISGDHDHLIRTVHEWVEVDGE